MHVVGYQSDLHRRLQHWDVGSAQSVQGIRAQSGEDYKVSGEPEAWGVDKAAGAGLWEDEGDLLKYQKPDDSFGEEEQQVEEMIII